MSETRSCEQCGAALAADARFCEKCGRAVSAPSAPAVSEVAAPSSPTPRPANRGLFVGLAIVGVVVALGCLAVGVFGFLLMQNQPGASSGLPANTPQVGAVSTRASQTFPTQPASIVPVVQDANTLLTAVQTQVASLKGARFTFYRTDGTTTTNGSGWVQMPDRAIYATSEGTERMIVRNQMWSRPNSTAVWATEIYVGPLNNPIAWLQILQCVTSPRVMPASTASGETQSNLSFFLASNAATCASAGSVQSLSGEGRVALRPMNDGITRLYYNLTYTGQQLRGGVNAPFQITVEFSDWNSGNLPAIEAPR